MHFLDHPAIALPIGYAAAHKYRSKIGGTIRLELPDNIKKAGCDITQPDLGIDIDNGLQRCGLDGIAHHLFEPPAEGLEIIGMHGHACSKIVTAIVFQQVAALVYGFVNIKAIYRTRRTGYLTIGLRQYDSGPVVVID